MLCRWSGRDQHRSQVWRHGSAVRIPPALSPPGCELWLSGAPLVFASGKFDLRRPTVVGTVDGIHHVWRLDRSLWN